MKMKTETNMKKKKKMTIETVMMNLGQERLMNKKKTTAMKKTKTMKMSI